MSATWTPVCRLEQIEVEGGVAALAISREPGGGSTEPTTDPIVLGEVA